MEVSASRPQKGELSVGQARRLIGVAASADAAEVARAYRRRARQVHPDVNVDPDATQQFWVLQVARRVALAAARRPDPTPAEVTVGNPTLVQVPPPSRSSVTVAARPGRQGAIWMAVGPVHLQPPP